MGNVAPQKYLSIVSVLLFQSILLVTWINVALICKEQIPAISLEDKGDRRPRCRKRRDTPAQLREVTEMNMETN